jgi:hypothetical protein
MTSKLRTEPPEALCHVINCGDQNEPPQRLRKLRRSCCCVNSEDTCMLARAPKEEHAKLTAGIQAYNAGPRT